MTTTPAGAAERESPIRVLLAEDEEHLGTILEQYLTARGFAVTRVRNGRDALGRLRASTYDVALLDIVMPELDGLEVLRQVREEPLPPEVIVITGNGTIETAIAALKLGAYDFLSKPYRMAEIDALVRRAWEKRMLTRDNQVLQSRLRRSSGTPRFVTQYAPLVAVRSLIERVAPSGSPVLISGESGTGKNVMARMLHELGGRPDRPFIDFNCAAHVERSLEAELFGMEKGARPGVDARTLGLMELAEGGTLYLDNIGELDLPVQAMLVRALETGVFCRVGGTQYVDVRVRVIASTTRDLARLTAAGRFRDDLLHRVSTIRVALPPLRERLTDVLLLAEYFLRQFERGVPLVFTPDAMSALERYRWPGNVWELRNVIERAVLLAADGSIRASDLSLGNEVGVAGRVTPVTALPLGELERRHIADVLERTHWHQGRAAELLGISPKTLYRKIREFGFRRPSGRS